MHQSDFLSIIRAWRTFRIFFIFFCRFGGREKEGSVRAGGGGGGFLLKIEGGGGLSEKEGGVGNRCREDVCKEGGGLKFFFGAKMPTKRGCQASRDRGGPLKGPGNFRGSVGNFRGTIGLLFRMTEDGGLSLRGVAVTTETAITAETAKTVKSVTVAS